MDKYIKHRYEVTG